MKLSLSDSWDHLFYYGWNILLCLCSGHAILTVVESLLLKEIPQASISYTLMMAICYSVVCFLANLIFKNVSMNVFSKGLCIFATDLRADRHSDWYCIRSVSLVIIRRVQRLLIY